MGLAPAVGLALFAGNTNIGNICAIPREREQLQLQSHLSVSLALVAIAAAAASADDDDDRHSPPVGANCQTFPVARETQDANLMDFYLSNLKTRGKKQI